MLNVMETLGAKIRKERKSLGLTIKEFAKLIGTSKATLQRVETGVKSPTIDLLTEISFVCRKPLESFIHDRRGKFHEIGTDRQRKIVTGNSEITIICPYGLISRDIVVNHFKAMPGASVEPHQDEGYEWIYVLKGKCIVEYDSNKYEFKEGEALFYDARKTHSYKILTPFESIRISVGH